MLPDCDQKKNLTLKLKRFAESMANSSELLSHRWRIYYQPLDLEALLSDDAWVSIREIDLYKDVTDRNAEVQGAALAANNPSDRDEFAAEAAPSFTVVQNKTTK